MVTPTAAVKSASDVSKPPTSGGNGAKITTVDTSGPNNTTRGPNSSAAAIRDNDEAYRAAFGEERALGPRPIAPNSGGNVGSAIGATARGLWTAGSALFRAGATTVDALATAGRYAGPAIGEAIIRNNNLKLKVGFEGGEGINFAQSFTRDLDFFTSSTEMGLGASAIAYGGIEWEIRHPQLGNTPPVFSFSTTAADGLAGGLTFDFGMVQWGDTRIPWLVNVKPFIGVGLGESLKLELPTPQVTGTSTTVNMHTGAVGGPGR